MSIEALQEIIKKASVYKPEWPEPVLFSNIETPHISPDLLPAVLRDFITALAIETETPAEMAMACALGTVSVALSGKVFVNPKPGWIESVNTYWLVELSPANRKSKIFKECTRPLIAWEKTEKLKMEPIITKAISKRKSQEKLIEKRRIEAIKEQDNQKRDKLFDEISELEADLEPIPAMPRLFSNNVTPEALENYAHEQKGRFAVLSDEGGVIETLTGLYTNGRANTDILLKGIDGGDLRVGRKDRNIDMNPLLTFVLCVQPKVREKMGRNLALQGNGALERFFYIIPRSLIGYRTHETATMQPEIQERYNHVISQLLSQKIPLDAEGNEQPYILTLSADAYTKLKLFEKWLEPKLTISGELFSCQGWAGKLTGYALRIAGLMHVVECGVSNAQISSKTMHNALLLANCLIQHTLAAFQLMGLDERIADAKYVFDWLLCKKCKEISRTELTMAVKGRIKSKQLDEAIDELTERHIIRIRKEPSGGSKDTTIYTVNPRLFDTLSPVTLVTLES